MTNAKPRVALLLSGLPRQWRPCLASQKFLLRDYPHDVFFHFWDSVDAREKSEIIDLLKPRAYRFETPQDFSHVDSDPTLTPDQISVPSRIVSQFYSWREVGKIFEAFKADYDLAIRSRSDLEFVYNLDPILLNLTPNDIVIPWWDEKVALSDLFAVGGVEPVLYYHTLYNHARRYAETREFNPELLLTAHFEQRPDIHLYSDQTKYFFVRRPHMEKYTAEQALQENLGRNKWLDLEITQAHADYHRRKKGEPETGYFRNFRESQLRALAEETRKKQ